MLKEHQGYEGNIYIDYPVAVMREFPERNALTDLTANRTFTYGELDKLTNQMDNKLRADGLKKDDVVMACLYNTWQFVVAQYGAWKTPCIFSPINFRLAPGEIAIHIEDSRPKVFIWDSSLDGTIKTALGISKHKPAVLLVVGESAVAGALKFEDYYKNSSPEDPDIEDRVREVLDPFADEILRHYTSGTTGRPKGTIESSLSLMMMDLLIIAGDNYSGNDRVMNVTPWFHQGGLVAISCVYVTGGHMFGFPLMNFNPAYTLDMVEKYKITVLWGSPVTFDEIVKEQQNKPRDISSVRLIHTMGSPFSKEQYNLWVKVLTPNIINGYGTTETRCDLALRSDIHPMLEKAGSAGRTPPFCQLRVVKIDPDRIVEPKEVVPRDGVSEGQIIMKSAGQFRGYFNLPELTAEKVYKGWFYCGDIGTWDKDGFVTIHGRTDDVIQSGAEKVYPVPVEECLMKHSKILDVFVVPLPHERWGEAVAAYVYPKPGEKITIEELDTHCMADQYLANYTRPRFYQILENEKPPYTATGKKIHYVLHNRAKTEPEKFIAIPSEKKKKVGNSSIPLTNDKMASAA